MQRKRPNYDAELDKNHGEEKDDMRASFFSGHASHAFTFATYTSLMMYEYANSPVLSTLYTVGAMGVAGVVAYSRVTDHAHNLTDVVVGGLAGTAISSLVFFRVQEIDKQTHAPLSASSWEVSPTVTYDDSGRSWYVANLRWELK